MSKLKVGMSVEMLYGDRGQVRGTLCEINAGGQVMVCADYKRDTLESDWYPVRERGMEQIVTGLLDYCKQINSVRPTTNYDMKKHTVRK